MGIFPYLEVVLSIMQLMGYTLDMPSNAESSNSPHELVALTWNTILKYRHSFRLLLCILKAYLMVVAEIAAELTEEQKLRYLDPRQCTSALYSAVKRLLMSIPAAICDQVTALNGFITSWFEEFKVTFYAGLE